MAMSHTTRGAASVPHQRLTCSGVVHASNTSRAGASKTRVITISRSEGRVTVAEPLRLVVIVLLLMLEFVQVCVQAIESLVPVALVVAHPVVDGFEPASVHPVEPLASVRPGLDQAHLAQHPQVLGDLGL